MHSAESSLAGSAAVSGNVVAMQRFLAKTGWLAAMASCALLLSVQTFHSPLHHLDCCREEAQTEAPHSGCCHGRHHQHAGQKSCSTPAPADDEPAPASHDCRLCEFLAQAIQPVEMPVILTGEERVAPAPAAFSSLCRVLWIAAPHVRGPPMAA